MQSFIVRHGAGPAALAAALLVSAVMGYVLIGRGGRDAAPSPGLPAAMTTTATVPPVAALPRFTSRPRPTLPTQSTPTATATRPAPLPTRAQPTYLYVAPTAVRPDATRLTRLRSDRGEWRRLQARSTEVPKATRTRAVPTPKSSPTHVPTAVPPRNMPRAAPSATLPPTAEPTRQIPPADPNIPLRLRIPAINLDAHIESVGLSGDAMDVPANPWDVAWFNLGPRPGVPGNAVIDGHLDTATSSAVFLHLGDLRPGDLLYVTTAGGVEHTFAVTELVDYPVDKAPMARIFGASKSAHLNLITCGGDWLPQQQNYNERLVVYTTLVA